MAARVPERMATSGGHERFARGTVLALLLLALGGCEKQVLIPGGNDVAIVVLGGGTAARATLTVSNKP